MTADPSSQFPDLPPYTYVPGHAPHPISDPNGHMRSGDLPEEWSLNDHYCWGIHLFDNGYYWEAHEAWEHVWLELGRTSAAALSVKGLIKLAAGAVKCREGNATGARRHATRAAELLTASEESPLFDQLNPGLLKSQADRMAAAPPIDFTPPSDQPVPLPGLRIRPPH